MQDIIISDKSTSYTAHLLRLKRKCTIKWEAAKMSRVYIRHHIVVQITFSSTTFFMHLMYCRVISSQWIKSRCSLSSKNKCIFQGFHAFFGSPVWENWHVERNMRFRIIIMSGCQACICFLASLTSFFPSSSERVLSSTGKFQATDLPDVPRCTFSSRGSPSRYSWHSIRVESIDAQTFIRLWFIRSFLRLQRERHGVRCMPFYFKFISHVIL